MKVICIDANHYVHPAYKGRPFLLKEGGDYSVTWEEDGCYHLEETDIIDPTYCYKKSRFIPLSSISETEMERDYNKVTQ